MSQQFCKSQHLLDMLLIARYRSVRRWARFLVALSSYGIARSSAGGLTQNPCRKKGRNSQHGAFSHGATRSLPVQPTRCCRPTPDPRIAWPRPLQLLRPSCSVKRWNGNNVDNKNSRRGKGEAPRTHTYHNAAAGVCSTSLAREQRHP